MLRSSALTLAGVAVWLAATPAFGEVLPTGGSVAAGGVAIVQPNANTLNINQSTNQAIINWNSFSIARGGTVNFNQPSAASSTLNRVTGTTPSWIAGTINAPGTVLLVNPNGIAITKSGVVNVGSFVASTLNIKDADYLSGNYRFTGNGSSAGVVNNGHINVSDGGFAALLGGQVANNGVIAARLGKVGLGAGEQATLDLTGDGFLQVAVPSIELAHMKRADGALVSNKGRINADGGTVFLSAATASNILRNAVNMGGTIRANSVGTHNGRIVINGGGGNVGITGKMLARNRTGKGGEINVTSAGAKVTLAGARLDASGATAGGVINIGGGPNATVALAEAGAVWIDRASTLRADAVTTGHGGHIVVWSGGQTDAQGTFSAKGGANGGDGGLIETSGHTVNFDGISINASAAKGAAGTWLIDPTDLTIDFNAAQTIGGMLGGGTSVTLQTDADGTASGPGNQSAGNGDINVNSNITWSSGAGTTLTLLSVHDINLNAGICCGAVKMLAAGSVTTSSSASLGTNGTTITAVGNITMHGSAILSGATSFAAGGNILITAQSILGTNPQLAAGGNIQLTDFTTINGGANLSAFGNISLNGMTNSNGGTITLRADSDGTGSGTVTLAGNVSAGGANVNIYYNPTSYTAPTNYSGSIANANSVTAYMLVNSVANLEAITGAPAGTYAMSKDIDASGVNFIPIGWNRSTSSPNNFRGVFDGQGHVVANLSIGGANDIYMNGQAGLFWENDGTIRNLGVTGSIFTGLNEDVGALAGVNGGSGHIYNSWSSATVYGGKGNGSVGGLVGINFHTIDGGSYATGSVTGAEYVGGLVGENRAGGLIQNAYATGSVHGSESGGLLGINRTGATVNQTYALGAVNGSIYTGGLVGENEQSIASYGVISNSYAAGRLSGSTIGGLVGLNGYPQSENKDDFNAQIGQSAKVFWSIWDADSTGTNKAFGNSYLDRAGYSSENVQFIGLVSANASLTSANGGSNLGNPYQISSYGFMFSDPTPGATQYQATSFNSAWYMVNGATRPFLTAEYSTSIQNAHQLQLIDMDGNANYTLGRNITYSNDGMWTSAGFSPLGNKPITAFEYQVYTRVGPGHGDFTNVSNPSANLILSQQYQTFFSSNGSTFSPYALQSQTYEYKQESSSSFGGSLNGNGFTISNLYVNTGGAGNAGLFDQNGGTISNLGIVNGSFNSWGGSPSAGSIAAVNTGTLTNVWATGGGVNGFTFVGGLVGVNTGTISQSYASVSVTGVTQSGSTFTDYDGGLVGYNLGRIVDSYATGNVWGNGDLGGLVGNNASNGVIQNTYATGQLFANWNFGIGSAGPLVGLNAGSVSSSYWNSDSWNASRASTNATYWFSPAAIDGSGTGRTTAQMQDLNSYKTMFAGFDFNYVWAPPNQVGQGGQSAAYYPQLYASSNVVVLNAYNVSRTYGAANPTLSAGLYSLGDIGRLASYSIGPIASTATQSSSVGTYGIGLAPAIPASAVGTAVSCSSSCPLLYVNINGVQIGPASGSQSNMLAIINSYTSITGVTGSFDASGHLVLTGSRSFNVSKLVDSGDPYGLDGTHAYTPAGSASASMLNGSTPRLLVLPGTLTVTPASLTITANSATKTYGQTLSGSSVGYQVSGLVNSDSISSLTLSSAGFAASAGVNGGLPYAIVASGVQGIGLGNYSVTYVNGGLTVNPATLTYTANAASMTYGGTVPGLSGTVTGFVNNDNLASITTGAASFTTQASATSNAGTYAITGGGLTLINPNYTFAQASSNATAFTVNKATLTVTGQKSYDASSGFITSQLAVTGAVNGQTVTLTAGSGNSGNANAGVYTGSFSGLSINVSGGSGTALASNYQLPASGTLTIDKANYTAVAGSKTYDGTTAFLSSQITLTGVAGQTFTVGAGTSNSANASGNPNGGATSFASLSGPIAGLNGADPNNYNLNLATIGSNSATINKANYASLTGSKTYDGATGFASSQLSLTGVNGETFTVASATSNSANASTNPNNAAAQFVSLSGITGNNGADPNNYAAPLNLGAGTLTTNQATINVASYVAINGSKTYDGSTSFLSGQVVLTGVNGETFNVAGTSNWVNASGNPNNPSTSFVATTGSITGIGGSDPNNYAPLIVGNLTGVNNVATINKANYVSLTGSKTYDGSTGFASSQLSLTGVNGETFAVASATSDSANASTNPNNPATRFVSLSGISGNNGADPNNYAAPLNLGAGTLTTNAATIDVASYTAISGSKTYDGNANFASSQVVLTGVNGETFGVAAISNSINASSNPDNPATNFVDSTGPISGKNGADPNNYGRLVVASLSGSNNTANIDKAGLTITASDQTKTYGDNLDLGTTRFTTSALFGATDSVTGVALASLGAGPLAGVAGSPYAIVASGAQGSGLANYKISYVDGRLTVTPAHITVTAEGGKTSVYGQSPANPGLSAVGLKNGEGAGVLTGLSNSFGIDHFTNVGTYTLNVVGVLTNPNYTVDTRISGTWAVTPATLTYVADPSTQFAGSSFPTFTGTVTGFVNGQTLANATTGSLRFTTLASAQSIPGSYAIDGSGLTANFGNYVFVQALGNATALTLNPAPATPPSQFGPNSGGPSNGQPTTFSLSNPATGVTSRVSFTPGATTGSTTSGTTSASNPSSSDISTSALPPGDAYVRNNGRAFPPISQYDSEQYSDFKLPPYAPNDSEATVLTILARGIAQERAAKYMIDGFWNGFDNTWPGPGNIDLHDKATFSDGAGHNVTPTNDPAFPIVGGQTDLAALLKTGPVMIGGSSAQPPVQWMLATGMAPDGKGLVCDDTMTGKLVVLAYDPATRTVGGATKIFDATSNSFVPLASASNAIPASDASGLAGLQTFVPSTYYAVTVH